MLNRLMRGAVFAQSDGIMRHHMDDADTHQRRQPDRRPAVVREGKKRAAIWDEAAVQRYSVHGGRHGVLPNAIVNITAVERGRTHRPVTFGARQVGMGKVGRAAQQIRQRFGDRVDHELRRLPRRDVWSVGREAIADISDRLGIPDKEGFGSMHRGTASARPGWISGFARSSFGGRHGRSRRSCAIA